MDSVKIRRNSEPNWEQKQIRQSSYKFLCGISADDADVMKPIVIPLPYSVEIPTKPFIYSKHGIISMKLKKQTAEVQPVGKSLWVVGDLSLVE